MCECFRREDGTWHVDECCSHVMDEFHAGRLQTTMSHDALKYFWELKNEFADYFDEIRKSSERYPVAVAVAESCYRRVLSKFTALRDHLNVPDNYDFNDSEVF